MFLLGPLVFGSAKYGFGFSTILALEWHVPAYLLKCSDRRVTPSVKVIQVDWF